MEPIIVTFSPPSGIYFHLHVLQVIHFDRLPNMRKTLRKKGRKMQGCLAQPTSSPMTLVWPGYTVSAHLDTCSSSRTPSSSRRRRRRDFLRKSPSPQPSVQLGPARLSGQAQCKSMGIQQEALPHLGSHHTSSPSPKHEQSEEASPSTQTPTLHQRRRVRVLQPVGGGGESGSGRQDAGATLETFPEEKSNGGAQECNEAERRRVLRRPEPGFLLHSLCGVLNCRLPLHVAWGGVLPEFGL